MSIKICLKKRYIFLINQKSITSNPSDTNGNDWHSEMVCSMKTGQHFYRLEFNFYAKNGQNLCVFITFFFGKTDRLHVSWTDTKCKMQKLFGSMRRRSRRRSRRRRKIVAFVICLCTRKIYGHCKFFISSIEMIETITLTCKK